ncbi:hypothetical protein [Cryobacterium sp. BB736]|uniref:hypothetical protein n=1 Tax=Cryobacterium sp. BB736 TaxID=2746963 RepID=UPI001875C788|nr:hypothetical protein [Cryobacterium sp. BB736]
MGVHGKNKRITVALWVAFAVSQANIARLLLPLGSDVGRLQTTADPTVFRKIMGGWTPAQREQYQRHLGPDTLHPFLYAAALIASGRAVRQPAQPRAVTLALIAAPAASAVLDLVENAFHARFTARPDDITPRDAALSGAATRTKWALALGSAVWIGVQAVRGSRS